MLLLDGSPFPSQHNKRSPFDGIYDPMEEREVLAPNELSRTPFLIDDEGGEDWVAAAEEELKKAKQSE